MKLRLSPLLLFALWSLLCAAPRPVMAGDAVAAALTAAQSVWPQAQIAALSPMASCNAEVIADTPSTVRNGETQVRVRCTGMPGWTRYLRLKVQSNASVAVLRAPLVQGQSLTPSFVKWETRDVLALPGDTLRSPSQFTDQRARRNLPAGTVLCASQFNTPAVIQRGQVVTLITRTAGMEVRAPGEALADASTGARVRVRNNASRRVVEGIARPDGTVEVAL